jgi:hypothetical protein
MSAEQFENSPEFRRFREGMKKFLKVNKAGLDRRVEHAKEYSSQLKTRQGRKVK